MTFHDDVTSDLLVSYKPDIMVIVANFILVLKCVTTYPAILFCVRSVSHNILFCVRSVSHNILFRIRSLCVTT